MADWHWIAEIARDNGLAVLLFVVLFFYLQTQAKAAKEQRETDAAREEHNFQVLQGFMESISMLIAQNSRIESKIDSNQMCPMVRKELGR